MKNLGLYIHIPFCIKKCDYCDFYSLCHDERLEEEYINALCSHIKKDAYLYKDYSFDTVFFGGGTPSVLSIKSFDKLVNCIKTNLTLTQGGEFTIEANPGTLNREKLECYKRNGVNRLSIGLQSTNDNDLCGLGRIHTLSEFEQGYYLARECGFDNISIDIMYGLPNQKLDDFKKTLDRVCEFNPEHISAYCLKIEENTPFGKKQDALNLPNDDEEYEMYMALCEALNEKGWQQYEISNFAKENHRSRHNLKYWLSQEYIGFGPSSHSFFNGERYFYQRDIKKYIEGVCNGTPSRALESEIDETHISKMDEYVLLKLRLSDGISLSEFKNRFSKDFLCEYPNIEKYVKSDHVSINGDIYSFTPKGFFVSNYILTDILHL